MSASQHTPTPWKFISHDHNPESQWLGNIQGSYGLDKDGIENIRTISCQTKYEISPGEARANADFMVRACNSHEALIKVAERALEAYAALAVAAPACAATASMDEETARAALKLAKS